MHHRTRWINGDQEALSPSKMQEGIRPQQSGKSRQALRVKDEQNAHRIPGQSPASCKNSVQFPYKKFIGLHELGSHTEASTVTSMIPRDNLFGINLSRNLKKKDTRQTPRPNLNRLNLSPSKVDQVSPTQTLMEQQGRLV